MPVQELLSAGAAKGYKADEEGQTLSGLVNGTAFRAQLQAGLIELSVNLPEGNLIKLQNKLAGMAKAYGDVTVAYHNHGIGVTLAGMDALSADQFFSLLDAAAVEAVKLAGSSYDDKFEKDREPVTAYLRGIAGAFLGALVGILPWFLVGYFLNFQMWYFGFLVSTGSFFGYRYLYGAHNTSFATTSIIICTILAVFISEFAQTALYLLEATGGFSLDMLVQYYQAIGLRGVLSNSLFGLIAAGVGLFAIKNKVMVYTHESWFLRRGPRRK